MPDDLTPERLARLRTWAARHDANRPDILVVHAYDGACPWCRSDRLQPGHDGYFDGNAHDLALELLDEIDRLRAALDELANADHEDDLLEAVSAAAKRQTAPTPDRAVDLMADLEQSVAAAKEARTRRLQPTLSCPKAPHTGTGYLHAEDDDRPYDIDGVTYCGRCHYTWPHLERLP